MASDHELDFVANLLHEPQRQSQLDMAFATPVAQSHGVIPLGNWLLRAKHAISSSLATR